MRLDSCLLLWVYESYDGGIGLSDVQAYPACRPLLEAAVSPFSSRNLAIFGLKKVLFLHDPALDLRDHVGDEGFLKNRGQS